MKLSDDELVANCIACGKDAFLVLINRYRDRIYNFAFRLLLNEEDASDVAQEAFIRCYYSLSKYKLGTRFSSWLFRVTHNLAIDRLRKRGRETEIDQEIADTKPSPEVLVEQKELKEGIDRAMQTLPIKYRVVVTLFHIEGLGYEEIGKVLGLPMGTVKTHLYRAREILRERLKEWSAGYLES